MLEIAVADLRRLVQLNVEHRERAYSMAQVALTKRHSGSVLGAAWAVVKPLTYLFAYWFAISVGMRGSTMVDGVSYLIWLMPGLMAWFFISDAITSGGAAIRHNSNLVTRLPYPVPTLPVSEVLSYFLVHLVMMGIISAMYLLSGYGLGLTILQLPYSMLCALVFGVVVATLLSALTAISSDILQGVKSLMAMLFWFVPVLWSGTNLASPLQQIVMANPITYVFSRLEPEFADVL